MWNSCQKVVEKLSNSCQKVVEKLLKSCQKLSKSCQKVSSFCSALNSSLFPLVMTTFYTTCTSCRWSHSVRLVYFTKMVLNAFSFTFIVGVNWEILVPAFWKQEDGNVHTTECWRMSPRLQDKKLLLSMSVYTFINRNYFSNFQVF